jgi:uracil-DNA glycosylase
VAVGQRAIFQPECRKCITAWLPAAQSNHRHPSKGETPQTCRRCELWERATQAVRGKPLAHAGGARIVATYHPSAILRADEEGALQLRRAVLQDLRLARKLAARGEKLPEPPH